MDLLPLEALIVFYFAAIVFRVAVQLRRFGGTGLSLSSSDAAFFILPSALFAMALLWAFRPQLLQPLLLAQASSSLRAAGLAVLAAGLALILIAQLQMGASWRVGIDYTSRPGLVAHGLFRYSRNPIYVGLLLALLGELLLMPAWPTLIICALAAEAVLLQVRREEKFLLSAYGNRYATYLMEVDRFVPRCGAR